MFAASCGSSAQAPSGALPVLKVRDTWTERSSVNGSEITSVGTVIGEQVFNGIDCYIFERTIPQMGALYKKTCQVDKTTPNANIGDIRITSE